MTLKTNHQVCLIQCYDIKNQPSNYIPMHNNAYFGTSKKKKKKSIPLLSKYILYFVGNNHGSLLKSVVTKSRVTVLNCANVCLPNILRTVQRTMIRFLIELLVRRTWFGQFDELYFVLNWLIMRCKLRPELAADA